MNYNIIWIFYFIFLRNCSVGELYQAIEACVFNSLQTFQISSPIECALKCHAVNCKGFSIDAIKSVCILYEYPQICQSNTGCPNQTIFVNDRYNKMYTGDSSGARFQLLKGIESALFQGNPIKFNVLNENQAMAIMVGVQNIPIIALGTYKNSNMIVLQIDSIIKKLNNGMNINETLVRNLMGYLTNGSCTNYSLCYKSIDDFPRFTQVPNLVFGVLRTSKFDLNILQNLIVSKRWHFIYAPYMSGITKNPSDLLKMYGICQASSFSHLNAILFVTGNICQNITKVMSSECTPTEAN